MTPLALAVGMLSTHAYAQFSPFATVPLDNQSITTISLGSVKPRIMIVFDDSGSMGGNPGSRDGTKSRMMVAVPALQQAIRKMGNNDEVEWGITTLGGNHPFVWMGGEWRLPRVDILGDDVNGSRKYDWQPWHLGGASSDINNDRMHSGYYWGWKSCPGGKKNTLISTWFDPQYDSAWAIRNNCVLSSETGVTVHGNNSAQIKEIFEQWYNMNFTPWQQDLDDAVRNGPQALTKGNIRRPYPVPNSDGSWDWPRGGGGGYDHHTRAYKGEKPTPSDLTMFTVNGVVDNTVDTDKGFVNTKNILRRLEFLKNENHTTLVNGYLHAVDRIIEHQDLVCRRNYVLLFTDGMPNVESGQSVDWLIRNLKSTSFKDGNLKKRYGSVIPKFTICSSAGYDHDGHVRYPYGTCYLAGLPDYQNTDFGEHQVHGRYTLAQWKRQPERHGIGLFSRALYNGDFMTSRYGNTKYPTRDKEGTPWDQGVTLPDGTTLYKQQNITTYALGFGVIGSGNTPTEVDLVTKYLDAVDSSGMGGQIAYDENDVSNVLDQIMTDIKTKESMYMPIVVGTASPAFAITSQSLSGASTNQLAAYLTLDSQNWGSELSFARINASNGSVSSTQLTAEYPKYRPFMMTTHNGKAFGHYDETSYSTSNNFLINSRGEVNTAFGMPALGTDRFNLGNSELNEGLLPWLLRAKADSAVESAVAALPVNRKVAKYRERKKSSLPNVKFNPDPRAMGDVLTSSIESVSKIEDGKKDQAKTTRFLLANANDGLLYIYENQAQSNANHPYKMKFTFLPAGMERERTDDSDTVGTNIYRTANDGYGNLKDLNSASANAHIYLNDGGVFWRTTSKQALDGSNAKGQQTFMFASMGRGARGFYGLNLQGKSRVDGSSIGFDVSNTPSSAWQKAVYLWESAKGANNALGYTYNTPQIGLIAQKLDRTNNLLMDTESDLVQSVFMANGYQPSNTAIATYKEPTVLLYSALGQTDDKTNGTSYKAADLGRELATITLKTKDGYTCNVYTDARDNLRKGGTASTPRLVDVNMDGIFDVMYVGDQCGNMWRVNMDRSDIANWKDNVHLIYKAPNNSAPITTRPAVYRINNKTLKNTQGQNYGEFVVLFGTGTNIYQSDITLPDQQYFMGVFDSTDSDKSHQRDAATIDQLVTQTLTENTVFKDGKNEVIRNITGYRDNNPNSPYYVPPMDQGGKGWKLELTGIKSATGLASSSEMVVTDSQVLMQTVYFTTVKYLKQNTQNNVDDGQETCYPKVSNTNTLVESFLMSLDVLTGSNPDPEKSNSYLSGWDAVNKDQNNMSKPIGGVLLEGAGSGVNIVSVNKVQSSINPNGGGESGEDGLDPGNKDCLTSDEWYAMFADQNGVHNDKLEIKRCPVGGNRLIRINQRQVY